MERCKRCGRERGYLVGCERERSYRCEESRRAWITRLAEEYIRSNRGDAEYERLREAVRE